MQRYWWPGFEIQLHRELQRQQHDAQFCDTLLQAEGISVPTHGCILAALSPYLSERLSASPTPPSGQKLELQLPLPGVKAQTLLKLVGLLYSGELEVKSSVEQNDVLSAARQFGITDLVEGQKDGLTKEGETPKKSVGGCRDCRERKRSRKIQDAQVQAEMARTTAMDPAVETRSCVSASTQTSVDDFEKTVGSSSTPSDHTKPPTPEPTVSAAPDLDFLVSLQPQEIPLDNCFRSNSSSTIPSIPSGTSSDGESSLDGSSDSVPKPTSTSALPSDVMTFPISLNDDSNSQTPQGDATDRPSPEGEENGNMVNGSENAEQPGHANREEVPGKEIKNCSVNRHGYHVHTGMKCLDKIKRMQQMIDDTQISVKVKLRRRTKGAVWEVVNMQDTDEALSVLNSMKLDASNHKKPQPDQPRGEPPPSSVQTSSIHEPETQTLQPAPTQPPPHTNTTCQPELLSSDCFNPDHHHILPQPPGPVEECDEQMEKLLEDIMMGLNILPSLDTDCKKSQRHHDRAPAICRGTENDETHTQCQMYFHDFGTQIDQSETDTGIHHCFTAQNQPSFPRLPSQVDAALIQQQQQQRSSQYHPSFTSMEQRDGTSLRDMPLSKSPNCPYVKEHTTTTSVIPTAFYSDGQTIHYAACQEPSSPDDQTILEFLPLTNGNNSPHVPCMEDLRLPPCLSPLKPSSLAEHRPVLGNSGNHSDEVPPQPSSLRRPWLTEKPVSLQFPLSAITHKADCNESLPKDTNRSCFSRKKEKHLELNPQTGDGRAGLNCTLEERGAMSAGHQNVEGISDPAEMTGSLICKQDDAFEPKKKKRNRTRPRRNADGSLLAFNGVKVSDGAAPKRRRRIRPSRASLLAYQDVKVSDETKGRINLSDCSVILSSNNVLAKEREMATSFSNTPNKSVWKPNEPPTITESGRKRTRGPGELSTGQPRIRTRGFVKHTQPPSHMSLEEDLVVKPVVAPRAMIVNEHGVLVPRKRGRPRKIRPKQSLPENCSSIIETKCHSVEGELKLDDNLPKEDEGKLAMRLPFRKQRRNRSNEVSVRRRRRNRNKVEVMPLEKTISAESPGEVEVEHNSEIVPAGKTPKRPRLVSLKEFQKLIKHQHSKTRKSKEGQKNETNETATDLAHEGKEPGSRFDKLPKEPEVDVDVPPPQNRDGIKEWNSVFHVTVDHDHNHTFNKSAAKYSKSQPDVTDHSTSMETSVLGSEYHTNLFSFDVVEEEVATFVAEREQPPWDPDKAQKAWDAGISDTTQQTVINDEGLSHSDNVPLVHNFDPQTPVRTGPPLLDAVRLTKSSGCGQEEEEEDVDILLYSPDKVPQTSECENTLHNMDMTPEEEEEGEEDVNDIDVTGDEAE